MSAPQKNASHHISTTFFEVLWPIGLLLIPIISLQIGTSLAKATFDQISPQGLVTLRLGFAACMMALAFRIWRYAIKPEAWRPLIVYSVTLASMNLCFYLSIARIPLGIAVALEFIGPLCLVLFHTRTKIDAVWVALVILGLLLLSPLNTFSNDLDPLGVLYALVAGVFWALYIIWGQRVGMIQGASAAAFGTIIAAICIFPIGVYSAGWQLFNPDILPIALTVALFSSAIPYSIEMIVLTRMPQQTFGILMSLEPAIAAFMGAIILNEYLGSLEWIALIAISFASIGSTVTRIGAVSK